MKTVLGISAVLATTMSFAQGWSPQISGTTSSFNAVSFVDANTGIAVGDGIIVRTDDGGENWVTLLSGSARYTGVSFVDAMTGWVVGLDVLLRTTDGGATWVGQVCRDRFGVRFTRGISFLDANLGMVLGFSCLSDVCRELICRTTDGGVNWSPVRRSPGPSLSGITWVDENTWIAVGGRGGSFITRTTNQGASWTDVYSSGDTAELRSVNFGEGTTGTAVGLNGTILRTDDLGASWAVQSVGTFPALFGVWFWDANIGTAVGESGTIIRTVDAGATWTVQSSGTTEGLSAVSFVDLYDPDIGTVVGNHGTILRTTTGGE